MNEFINKVCKNGNRVRVWTTNGYQMSGVIVSAEQNYIVLDINGMEHMIYKHAISTIRKEG